MLVTQIQRLNPWLTLLLMLPLLMSTQSVLADGREGGGYLSKHSGDAGYYGKRHTGKSRAPAGRINYGFAGTGYIGIDGTSLNVENNQNADLNPRGLRLRLGVPIGRNVDIEAHLGGGSDHRTQEYDNFSTGYAAAFIKGYLPVGYQSAFYALGGIAGVEYTQTIDDAEFSDSRSGLSYGFGLETQVSRRLDLSADYIRYVRDDGPFTELSGISLGLKWYF